MLDQVKQLGFNVLRIPFCNENIMPGVATNSINYQVNPDLAGLSSIQTLDKIVAYCGAIGLKIFLDRHSAKRDNFLNEPLWYIQGDSYHTPQRFIQDWVMLAQRYQGTAVIGADLWNEPKNAGSSASTWGTGNVATDWNTAAEQTGNAILAANSDWLIIVEGTWQDTWWGGDLRGVATHPIVLTSNKLVYSAHEYCQDVYNQPWLSDPSFPSNMRPRWDRFWGYIFRQQLAPILIGEFGTKFAYPNDAVWLETLMNYMDGQLYADGNSSLAQGQQGMSWTFWCLNPNSGDTGGILLDDWQTVDAYKMSFLTASLAPLLPSMIGPSPSGPPTKATTTAPTILSSRKPTAAPQPTSEPSAMPTAPSNSPTEQPTAPTPETTWMPSEPPTFTVSAAPSRKVISNSSNPFIRTPAYYVNPTYQQELQSSIVTASGQVKATLQSMLHVSSAYWLDVKSKISGSSTSTAQGILEDAASKPQKQLVTLVIYDLPNRDCHVSVCLIAALT
jgi:endoglucanase